VIRLTGSKVSSFLSKSMAYGDALGKSTLKSLPFLLGRDLTKRLDFSLGILLISSSVGVPIISKMSSIWFLVSEPGR